MQRMANLRQLRTPAAVGQEAKMADPHEALRQDMQQVTANEFGAIEPEVFFFPVVPVILVTQGDRIVIESKDSAVRDRAAVGVAGKIVDNVVGVVDAVLGVHHPFGRHQLIKDLIDLARVGHPKEFAALGGLTQAGDHLATEAA